MSDKDGPEQGRDEAGTDLAGPGKGKLLHLSDFETAQPDRILHEVRSYWDSLRQGRAIPARADVDPRGIRRALDYAFILERIAPGAARFRLAGRHLVDLMGMEIRGMPICSLLNTTSRGRLSDVLESVFRAPQIAEIILEAPAGFGRPGLSGKLLLLPLRSDLGDVTRALGCMVTRGEIGEAPRRFDITGDQVIAVIPGAKIVEPSPSTTGFAEAPAGWQDAAFSLGQTIPEDATPEERRARFRVISDKPEKPDSGRRM